MIKHTCCLINPKPHFHEVLNSIDFALTDIYINIVSITMFIP